MRVYSAVLRGSGRSDMGVVMTDETQGSMDMQLIRRALEAYREALDSDRRYSMDHPAGHADISLTEEQERVDSLIDQYEQAESH